MENRSEPAADEHVFDQHIEREEAARIRPDDGSAVSEPAAESETNEEAETYGSP